MGMQEQRDKVMRGVYAQRGLAAKIARRLGLGEQAVHQWRRVPAEHVMDIVDLLGMTPEQVRPDVFKPRKRAG